MSVYIHAFLYNIDATAGGGKSFGKNMENS